MRRVAIGLLLLAGAMHAGDVTGTWSGQVAMTRGSETKAEPAHLVLKQAGAEVTGTVGPNAERQHRITKGTAEGDDINIEAVIEGENKIVMRLKLDGDKLTGDLKAVGPTAPQLTGKLNVSKEK